jgi:hypothetical protein
LPVQVWDDADDEALRLTQTHGLTYCMFHPLTILCSGEKIFKSDKSLTEPVVKGMTSRMTDLDHK